MSLLKNKLYVLAIVAAALPAGASVESSTITTPHFYVTFAPRDEYDAKMVAGYAEDSMAAISAELGYAGAWGKRTPIRVLLQGLSSPLEPA